MPKQRSDTLHKRIKWLREHWNYQYLEPHVKQIEKKLVK